jgi:ribulose-phosphate 3-epimerase
MSKTIIAPSLLSADFANLEKAFDMLNKSEAEWIHLDIMDGNFVPNITFGMPVIKSLRKLSGKVFDAHLMIEKPERYLHNLKIVGVDVLTVHYETQIHLNRTIDLIKKIGMKAGVALNPHTPVSLLKDIIKDIDLVLIMSVNPGFGGQQFIENSYNKIAEAKEMIIANGSKALIQVDGGVTADNAQKIIAAGADVLVAGSYIFHHSNPIDAIKTLKGIS